MNTRREPTDSDWTDVESEGQPELETRRPGIDSETSDEGRFLPRDVPIAAEEIGITACEASVPEYVFGNQL